MASTHLLDLRLYRHMLVIVVFCIISWSHASISFSRCAISQAGLPHSSKRRRRIGGTLPISSSDQIDSTVFAASTRKAAVPKSNMRSDRLTYRDLSPVARIVAGTVEVALVTAFEYASGYAGGYFLGSITDLPRLLFRSTSSSSPPMPLLREVGNRLVRTHIKSNSWARNWAGISATLGGMNVAIKVARGGVEDDWNTVLSSMAAGAFFARKEGPQAMIRGAVIYGGLVYVLYGGFGTRKKPFEYQEQPIEF